LAYLLIIVVYAAAQIALGLWAARRVRQTGEFFVAGRSLGPGLLFATCLAANIGGGSTLGATALGYQDGLAAWWWVGSAAIGSVVMAAWIGPRIRALAARHDLKTVGDFLEWRYDSRVRATIAILVWIGSVAILAGQLIGMSRVLGSVTGISKLAGCAIGAIVVTVYFGAGGLRSAAVVNVVQLSVKLVGFAIALPLALHVAGGFSGLHAAIPNPAMWSPWHNGHSGWMYVALLGPAFIVSPGLLQKVYGAKDDRAVHVGVGLNALVLFAYAVVPAVLGMIALARHPNLPAVDLALPTLFVQDLPFWVGALGLAAIFSAEVSAADAVIFMLATSLSQDLYKRFVNPRASDAQVLRVARLASLLGGVLGIAMAFLSKTIVDALSIFYTLIGVSLFVPVIAGLYAKRARPLDALAAIAGGVAIVAALQFWNGGRSMGVFTPAMCGLIAAVAAFASVSMVVPSRRIV
jgi:SSS family solute:Na+ symporter